MARGTTVSGTTGTVTASGGTLGVHITGVPNYLDILKVKIQPSGGAGPFTVELFSKDTLSSTDLYGKWQDVGGNIYDPMNISTGSPAEGNPAAAIIAYEDADSTGELHFKFTNDDSSDRTYSYTIVYEARPLLDSGTYTPTLTNIANLDGSTSDVAFWQRIGDTVTVVGTLMVDPTSAGITTEIAINLPSGAASNLNGATDLTGHGHSAESSIVEFGFIQGHVATDTAQFIFLAASTASHRMGYTFSYTVFP